MNDVMLWLSSLFINFNGFSAMLMSNDLALVNSTNTLSASLSTSSPTLSQFSLLSLSSSSKKVLKKKVRISPILKSKMESTTTTTTQRTNTTSSTEQFPLLCDPIRPRRNAIEAAAAGGGASRPRNNYFQQLQPKEIIRKRRLAPLAHRQKRTGFPPIVPPSPASSAFQRPVFPAPASVPDYSNTASQFEQPEPPTAEQAFRQGVELPEASESFQPPPAAQPPAQFVEPSAPMFQSSMGTGPVGLTPAVEPSASFFQQPVAVPSAQLVEAAVPMSEPQVPVPPSSVPENEQLPAAVPMSEPQVPVPPSSVPENEQLPAAVPMSEPQVPVPPSSVPEQSGYKEMFTSTSVLYTKLPTSTTATEPYELLRYPLPECYTDDSNLMCCNPELENTMKMAFDELVSAEDDFQRCNVQQIANKALSEDRFNTSFEVISGIGDFASRSHFFHNLICKIEQSGRFILAYATARPEFNSLCIDGDTAGITHAGGGGHASGDFRNSESVQQGEYRSRPATEKSDLLNFVYTFRRN